jgi:aryl-alcohol dehydrogenase-like predicted oxidoreductase
MTYSLLARDVEYDVVPMMKQYGLGMMVWSPLTSGFLSGKYTRENLGAANIRLAVDEITMLDEYTKPRPVYPHWFNEMTVDGPVKNALVF